MASMAVSSSAQRLAPAAGCRAAPARSAAPRLPVARRAACVRTVRASASSATPAEQRWEGQVRAGKVRNILPSDVKGLLADGWVLLDVRPPNEVEKVAIEGAVEVPVYVLDEARSISGLIKQATAFGMGGWWLGGGHNRPNLHFLGEVQAKVPKDKAVIVACQKGLRSLAAAEQLARAGYPTLAWINGGLDTSKKGDIPTVGGRDVRYAGIGGLSELLGWTEVQREEGTAGPVSFEKLILAVAVVLALDLALFGYELLTAAPPPQ